MSIRSLPRDRETLSRWFKEELARGQDPLDVNDVWPENYSANSCQKVWAAKFAARHPNVVALDLSSFKCGHDAPTYGLIDSILGASKTPHLTLHDIDANKPGGSLKIRVKTFHYSLTRTIEALQDRHRREQELTQRLQQKREELLQQRRERASSTPAPAGSPSTRNELHVSGAELNVSAQASPMQSPFQV